MSTSPGPSSGRTFLVRFWGRSAQNWGWSKGFTKSTQFAAFPKSRFEKECIRFRQSQLTTEITYFLTFASCIGRQNAGMLLNFLNHMSQESCNGSACLVNPVEVGVSFLSQDIQSGTWHPLPWAVSNNKSSINCLTEESLWNMVVAYFW